MYNRFKGFNKLLIPNFVLRIYLIAFPNKMKTLPGRHTYKPRNFVRKINIPK